MAILPSREGLRPCVFQELGMRTMAQVDPIPRRELGLNRAAMSLLRAHGVGVGIRPRVKVFL